MTIVHRDVVYNVRPITERLSTGGGLTHYSKEGLVDIVDGPCSFRTLPALVASHPSSSLHTISKSISLPTPDCNVIYQKKIC